MKIENDKWVEIHYTLKDDAGQQLDSSVGNEPLGYVHGRGYLIPGLENLLAGHEPGDKFSAHIEPKDGYGEYDERLIVELDREKFEFDGEITVGMPFQMMTSSGLSIVHVTKVEGARCRKPPDSQGSPRDGHRGRPRPWGVSPLYGVAQI